jgi:hypothetical protein
MRALPGARGRVGDLDGLLATLAHRVAPVQLRGAISFQLSAFSQSGFRRRAPGLRAGPVRRGHGVTPMVDEMMPREPPLLDPVITGEDGERRRCINDVVRWTDPVTGVFFFRMEQLKTIIEWLEGYFRAAAILLQVPGAAEYRSTPYESDDDLWDLVWNPDTGSTLNVMAAALERLNAGHLLRQAPGGEKFKRAPLPVKARICLAERDRNGLISVVADCLDRLLVVPEIPGEAEFFDLLPRRPGRRKRRARKRQTKREEKTK